MTDRPVPPARTDAPEAEGSGAGEEADLPMPGGPATPIVLVGRAVGRKACQKARHARSLSRPRRGPGSPAVLLNTIPKAGTHLADRLVMAHLALGDSGRFLASNRSVSGRSVEPAAMAAAVDDIRAGELARGHVELSREVAEVVDGAALVHILLVRDPRDVFVSELRYLQRFAPWNHLARALRRVGPDRQLTALLHGFGVAGTEVEPFATRLQRYASWIGHPAGAPVVMRYEDLVVDPGGALCSALGPSALSGPAPSSGGSHTFREGRPGAWARLATEDRDAVDLALGDLVGELGYAR